MFNPELICGETLEVFLWREENLYPLIAERHGVQQNTQIATFIKKFILGERIWDNIFCGTINMVLLEIKNCNLIMLMSICEKYFKSPNVCLIVFLK